MKKVLQLISLLGLALSLLSAVLVFTGTLSRDSYQTLLVVGMLLWFGTAIFWIKPDQLSE